MSKRQQDDDVSINPASWTNYGRMEDGNNNKSNSSLTRPSLTKNKSSSSAHRGNSFREEPLIVGDIKSEDDEEQIYIVKQKYGYLSILFSIAQSVILGIMMWQCGIAPMNINPMVGPYPDALSEWGGKNAVDILDNNEWWRLMTPILLHAGIIHLLCNVAVQLETGAFFEREWGSASWLGIYLVSAVGSSILSVIIMPNSISVGSSGAVMGLFGGKLAEWMCRVCEHRQTEQARIGHEVRNEQLAGVLCSVLVVGLFSFIPYVDWAAHLGGLIAGWCVGMILFSLHHGSDGSRYCQVTALLIGIGCTVAYFLLGFVYMYSGNVQPAEELRDVCGYYQQFFDDYECKCQRGGE